MPEDSDAPVPSGPRESASAWRLKARKLKDKEDYSALLVLAKDRLQSVRGDPLASAYLGYALAAQGNRDVALASLARAANEPSERIPVLLLRSRLLHELAREAESIELLEVALAETPRDAPLIKAIIQAHIAANRPLSAIQTAHRLIEVSPQDVASWRALCETAMGVGHYAEAVEAAGKVLALDPNDNVVARYQALSLLRLGYVDQSLLELKGHLQGHPEDQAGWHDLGLIQASRGMIPEAIESFEKAVKLEPNDPRAQQALGVALAKTDGHARALEVLMRATELDGNNPELWYNQGVVLSKLKRDKDALNAYETALAMVEGTAPTPVEDGSPPPLHLPSAINRGIALARMGEWDEAQAQLEKALAVDAHNTSIMFNLANIQYLQGDFQGAYSTFRRLHHHDPFDIDGWRLRGETLARSLEIDPTSTEAWISKGNELFAKRAYVEAHECFRRAMDIDPNNPTARARRAETLATVYGIPPGDAAAWLRTARMLMELRLLSDAVDALSILFTLQPQNPDGRVLVGRILQSLGRQPLALKQAELALRNTPNHAGALILKGETLLQLGRPKDALPVFELLLTSGPQDPMVLTLKGITLCKLEQGGAGLQLFDEAIRLDPRHREAWYQKGVELERQGRYASAVEAFVQGFQ